MEGKKQEIANDEEGKETRGSPQKRGDQRGQTAKDEFLGLKLRRGITAAGRKSGGGAHTPVPTWKMEPDDLVGGGEEGVADEVGPSSDKGRRSSVSARQLGASLWEIQSLAPRNKNGRRGGSVSGAHRQRHGKGVEDEDGEDDGDLSEYGVHRSVHNCAEVHRNSKRWEVNLDERTCTCRAWQVKGVPCRHAAAFIATLRNVKLEDYVDSHFTVDRFKAAYALGVAPMPSKDEWINYDLGYKLLPPLMKRPAGRPRKRRIKASDEIRKKKSNKCSRCGLVGHHKNTCKNPVPLEHEGVSQITQESTNISGGNKGKKRSHKRACTTNLFNILQEERA